MKAPLPVVAIAGVALVGAVGLWIWKKGGVANAAAAVGAGVVTAAGGAASGAVGAIGSAVGLPTPDETTTDAAVARWIIDNVGTWEASQWAGAPAFVKALLMPAGSGTPPSANSPAGREFLSKVSAPAYDETNRLAGRYPPASTGPDSIFNGSGSFGQLGGLDGGTFDSHPWSFP